jgi:hypothetical protein
MSEPLERAREAVDAAEDIVDQLKVAFAAREKEKAEAAEELLAEVAHAVEILKCMGLPSCAESIERVCRRYREVMGK